MSNQPPRCPRLRSSVAATHDGTTLTLTALADADVHEYDADAETADIVRSLDGTSTVDELVVRHGSLAQEVVTILHDDDLLADGPVRHTEGRWSNQLRFLAELGDADALQRRLRDATVAIVGLGGVGNWLAQTLASVGVGRIVAIDADVVESSNRNRQVVFEPSDVGTRKVDALRSRLTERFASEVVPVAVEITAVEQLRPLLDEVSLVVCCADQPDVRTISGIVAEAARQSHIPAIVGGAYGAAVGAPGFTIVPGASPCWDCAVAASESAGSGPGRDVTPPGPSAGSFAPLIAVTGSMAAWEACRVLLGLEPVFAGRLREFDATTLDWRERAVPRRSGCSCAVED